MKKILFVLLFFGVISTAKSQTVLPLEYREIVQNLLIYLPATTHVSPENATPTSLVDFAKSMLGIPYHYATRNPKVGFDCSGFVSYVFSNFGFKVPRSSREFAYVGKEIGLNNVKVGDILLFTGTNSRVRKIGHIGIVYAINENGIKFIHASSGKAGAVTITDFEGHYKDRFMKAISLFN